MKNAFHGTAHKIIRQLDGSEAYYYHRTAVAVLSPTGDTVQLTSGGWRTATTKRTINQALDGLGYSERVTQRDFNWFIGDTPFFDGIVLTA